LERFIALDLHGWIFVMFRLTAVLLAAVYATMSIWGEPIEEDVVVARANTMSPTLPGLGATADADDEPRNTEDLSAITERKAVEMALAAGDVQPRSVAPENASQMQPEENTVELWYVTGSRVNLRSGPSTNSAVVGGVSLGDRAEVLSDPEQSWTKIRTEQGLEAWIYSRFLSETPA
jgi:hypothetical protein